MSAPRRRRKDHDEHRPFWRGVPHHYLYPAAGFVLGLGSPVGAFVLRYWLADPVMRVLWMRHELSYNFLFYAYMGVGTVTAFMVFGYAIGLRSEAERIRSRQLSLRVEELHLKSVTDGLTGAYTHGYLHEALELEIQQALTTHAPVSVMVLDIDDFKRVNDSHGHLFGDRVIKETCETIAAHVRSEDVVGRYGGDEFVVIMPGADAATALHVAGRVRAGVAKNGFLTTVSIGVATFDGRHEETPSDLFHRADMNLYQAKHDGKNRVSDTTSLKNAPRRRHGDVRA
ncbi:MAG: GGDEF domain-containing protein [Elusimicrobiota bacterium]|nr:GGDEF domain-containing protein [Elusimicrobiota bacterium]